MLLIDMRQLNERFEDQDYETLLEAKGKLTWRTWLMATARSQLEGKE